MNLPLTVIAQTTAPVTTQPVAEPPSLLRGPMLPLLLMVVVLYFFMFKNRRNQDKQRTDMLGKLKPGQRIQTIGGVLGTVTQVNEKEVTVKVDETNNVKIKFTRGAIHRVIDEEKPETK